MAPTVGSPGRRRPRAAAEQPRRGRSRNTTEIGVAFDGAAAGASASSRRAGVRRSQADLAVVAQAVEPGRARSRRSRRASSSGSHADRRRLVALQLLEHGDAARRRRELGAGRDVLPAQQEAHEVLGGRRLDAARAGTGASTSACGPAAGGPPTRCSAASGRVAALQREALVLEHGEPGRDPRRRQRGGARPASSTVVMPAISRWPRSDRGDRVVVAGEGAAAASSRRSVVHHSSTPSCSSDRAPGPRSTSSSHSGRQSVAGADDHERAQQVVQVVGGRRARARSRRAPARWPRGRGAPIDAEVDGEPAPQVHRVGAPVLELLVVEERVRPGGEDLVREHRRLGGVDAVHRDRARLDALEQRRAARRRRAPRAACRRWSGARARGRGSRSGR